MQHQINADFSVSAIGDSGETIAVCRWPSHQDALDYATRMALMMGGSVVDRARRASDRRAADFGDLLGAR